MTCVIYIAVKCVNGDVNKEREYKLNLQLKIIIISDKNLKFYVTLLKNYRKFLKMLHYYDRNYYID